MIGNAVWQRGDVDEQYKELLYRTFAEAIKVPQGFVFVPETPRNYDAAY